MSVFVDGLEVAPRNAITIGAGQIPGNVSVGATSTVILAANGDRKWCALTNIGARDVYVSAGEDAEVGKGMLIGKNGGSMLMESTFMSIESMNGITSTGTATVMFQEGN